MRMAIRRTLGLVLGLWGAWLWGWAGWSLATWYGEYRGTRNFGSSRPGSSRSVYRRFLLALRSGEAGRLQRPGWYWGAWP